MRSADPNDYLDPLLRQAERLGHRDTVVELLTRHTGSCISIAAFLEAGMRVMRLAKELSTTEIEILTLCGVPVNWSPMNANAALPALDSSMVETLLDRWLDVELVKAKRG